MSTLPTTVVFLGPSLDPADAAALLPTALIRPPAQRGDIYRAVQAGASTVGLIDGYYEHLPPPWHKEILFALEAGCRVLGASSMGAIRAAELADFGMEGVGEIYQMFTEDVFSDADVSLSHGPGPEYRPVSEAVANVYFTLQRAQQELVLADVDIDRLLSAARSLFYPERTYRSIVDQAQSAGLPDESAERFLAFVAANAVNQKRADALLLIAELTTIETSPRTSAAPLAGRGFNRTAHFISMCDEEDALVTAEGVDRYAVSVVDELRLQPELHDRMQGKARLAALSHRIAEANGIEVTQQLVDETSDQIRTELGLLSPNEFHDWLVTTGLSLDDYAEFVQRRALAHWGLHSSHGLTDDDQLMIDELRLSGELGRLAERSSSKAAMLRSGGYDEAGSTILREDDSEHVLQWYFESHLSAQVPADIDRYAKFGGFSGREDLVRSARREYRFVSAGLAATKE